MIKSFIIFIVFIFFSGCASSTYNNDLSNMDNHIIILSSKKFPIKFYDSDKITYPDPPSLEHIYFGDGILYYKLNEVIQNLKIPPNKKARIYIIANNDLLKKDIEESLIKLHNISIARDDNMIDFFIKSTKNDKYIDLNIYGKDDTPIIKLSNIDIDKIETLANSSNLYIKVELQNGNIYKIRRDTVYFKDIEGTPGDEKISAKDLSFNKANKYCKYREKAVLPKLYVFEKARRLGYIRPPIGTSKEFISGYRPINKRQKDLIPDDSMSIIIFDWKSGKYIAYERSFKNDVEKFRDISFRCMRWR